MATTYNNSSHIRKQAGWTSAALLGLCLNATLAQTNQHSSGLCYQRYKSMVVLGVGNLNHRSDSQLSIRAIP